MKERRPERTTFLRAKWCHLKERRRRVLRWRCSRIVQRNQTQEGCCTYLEYAKAYLEQTEVKLLRKELVAGEAQRRCSTRVSEMSRQRDAKNERCQRKELSTEEILTETERYFITNK
jgi:hypothetical protein